MFHRTAQHHVVMTEHEGLARKRKVRVAHRGSVTRIIGQSYEQLESEGPLTYRDSLDILSKFDGELIVKLPKLSMKKFNGDLTKWITFWDSFSSSMHSNPSLSNVDKFNYLNSLLESTAAESIAGLTLTSVNYDEAVATLKRRFGNTQLIVSKHMDVLLNLPITNSHHNIKGLGRLYDSVEVHVRGLRALGVTAVSYGGLLTSILMNKL